MDALGAPLPALAMDSQRPVHRAHRAVWGPARCRIYLAPSDDVQGLIAQGRTIQETIEIARDVAKKLIEAQTGTSLPTIAESFDYPVIVAT
jgi:predicted RNase H-like HicB family nuclease